MTMEQINLLKQYADQLRLTNVRNNAEVYTSSPNSKPGYMDYTCNILEKEVMQRQKTEMGDVLNWHVCPIIMILILTITNFSSLNKSQLQQLRNFYGLIRRII